MTTRVPGWFDALGLPMRTIRPQHPLAQQQTSPASNKATRARRKTERQNRKRGRK